MAASYLVKRFADLTFDSLTKTITHGLSRDTANLNVQITAKETSPVYLVGLTPQIALLRAAAAGVITSTCDVAVFEIHSTVGGPATP